MELLKKIDSKIKYLLAFPRIGRAVSTIFGILEVPILEFRRIFDSRISPGFFDWSESHFNQIYGSTVIPINSALESDYQIVSTEELVGIIERLPSLALGYCYCRTTRNNCDNPKWTCIHVGTAEKLSEVGKRTPLKSATIDEIKRVLYKADKIGLVHQLITAPTKEFFYVICNCCPCCCVMLNSVNRLINAKIVRNSHFIAVHKSDICAHCGSCVERCHFDALNTIEEKTVFFADNCVGCGLCVSVCSYNALKLIPRN